MNIYSVPMLLSGVLCTVLSVFTYLFRRQEKINRVFSFYTLALAIDSYAFFFWFQFGAVEHINTWMRLTFTQGFLIPFSLIYFFLAFTDYDNRLDEKVLKLKVRYFKIISLAFILSLMLLSQFSNLILNFDVMPEHIWDVQFGKIGEFLFTMFAFVFVYLFTMAFKAYKTAQDKPRRRFILLLLTGTAAWIVFGYVGAIIFPPSSELWHASSYMGTAVMAVFFFLAILYYQSDRVYELNLSLERKVETRTLELKQKNKELEQTLLQLKEMQKQVIMQEKMATLGQLVAGLTHEINTPISAIRSLNDTKAKAAAKLHSSLANINCGGAENKEDIKKVLGIIARADKSISEGTERLNEIISNLKNFARLDEAETSVANIHEGIDSVLALISREMLENIEVIRNYGDIPPFVCQPRKLNQVFFNIIKNACQAIENKGTITISTKLENDTAQVIISDTGKGMGPEQLNSIFDPGFITRGAVVRASLGLSISYQIIREHHGDIIIESEIGRGSTVTMLIPTQP